MAPKKSPFTRHWYRVSVDTVRGWVVFCILVALVMVSLRLYQLVRDGLLRGEAVRVIEEAERLVQQTQNEQGQASFDDEVRSARESLSYARDHYAQGSYQESLNQARRSREVMVSVLDSLHMRGPSGEAQFVAVHGGVEFRRGERGEWLTARSRVVLRPGDYVKTVTGGSAEIIFSDGTLYRVRPNTLLLVTRTRPVSGAPSEEAIALEYGWVNLNTAQHRSRIVTPQLEARVARESEAVVAYDRSTAVTRVAAYRGEVEVANRDGSGRRRLEAMQQLVQRGGAFSEPRPLPASPVPQAPEDQAVLDLGSVVRLELAWQPVPGAVRYALQVSRDRNFVGNIIDVENRTRTRATLGLQGEGTFLWRVAAYGAEGLKGPWSAPRTFAVKAAVGGP